MGTELELKFIRNMTKTMYRKENYLFQKAISSNSCEYIFKSDQISKAELVNPLKANVTVISGPPI